MGIDQTTLNRIQKDADLKALKDKLDSQQKMLDANKRHGPGYEALEQNAFEKQAGVTPPGYEGTRNAQTGELLDQYKINPITGEFTSSLANEARSVGPSKWAKAALGQQGYEESQARANAGLQQQQANSSAMANLSRMGGLGGGARTSLARSGARDLLMAKQGVANQGILARYGINNQDLQRKQELTGQLADVERQAQVANVQTLKDELKNRAIFDANRYNEQMRAWGAKQTADATRAAGGGGGGKK
jgi:hypothetical protein